MFKIILVLNNYVCIDRLLTADKCYMEKYFACVRQSQEEEIKLDCPIGYVAHKANCLKYEKLKLSYHSAKVRKRI